MVRSDSQIKKYTKKKSHCRAVGQERLVGSETQTLVDLPQENIVALDYQGKKLYRATLVVSVCVCVAAAGMRY